MKQIQTKYSTRYRRHDIWAGFVAHIAITRGDVAAQSLAGHADFRTTLAYIQVVDEVKRAVANRAVRPGNIPTKSPRQKSQTAKKRQIRKSRKLLKENGAATSPARTVLWLLKLYMSKSASSCCCPISVA